MGTRSPTAPRLALVGWANPHAGTGPLDVAPRGSTGWRLWQMTGLPRGEYMALLRLNAADFAGRADLWRRLRWVPHVVFLGRQAARFADVDGPFFEEVAGIMIIPHPSGRCRLYNDPDVRRRAEEFLRSML